MSVDRAMWWPVAIWADGQWLEADRKLWPKGTTEHVITEVEPALGVLNVGTAVLGAEAFDELERARGGDFGEAPRPAWLVIAVRAELGKKKSKHKPPAKGEIGWRCPKCLRVFDLGAEAVLVVVDGMPQPYCLEDAFLCELCQRGQPRSELGFIVDTSPPHYKCKQCMKGSK